MKISLKLSNELKQDLSLKKNGINFIPFSNGVSEKIYKIHFDIEFSYFYSTQYRNDKKNENGIKCLHIGKLDLQLAFSKILTQLNDEYTIFDLIVIEDTAFLKNEKSFIELYSILNSYNEKYKSTILIFDSNFLLLNQMFKSLNCVESGFAEYDLITKLTLNHYSSLTRFQYLTKSKKVTNFNVIWDYNFDSYFERSYHFNSKDFLYNHNTKEFNNKDYIIFDDFDKLNLLNKLNLIIKCKELSSIHNKQFVLRSKDFLFMNICEIDFEFLGGESDFNNLKKLINLIETKNESNLCQIVDDLMKHSRSEKIVEIAVNVYFKGKEEKVFNYLLLKNQDKKTNFLNVAKKENFDYKKTIIKIITKLSN